MAADIFLNVPFDEEFQPLFLAYTAGVSAFGTTPRIAPEVDRGEVRLERISSLIAYIFESRAGRIDKSLSDIKGVDVHVHNITELQADYFGKSVTSFGDRAAGCSHCPTKPLLLTKFRR